MARPPRGEHEYGEPLERFNELSPKARLWLQSLDDEKIKQLESQRRFFMMVQSWGIVTKWLFGFFFAVFVGMIALGDGFSRLWHLFGPGGTK